MAKSKENSEKRPPTSAAFVRGVGERLRQSRIKAGKNQADVAKALGLTSTAISNYESGASEMPLGRLSELADCLGVTTLWLVAGINPDDATTRQIQNYEMQLFFGNLMDLIKNAPEEVAEKIIERFNKYYGFASFSEA